MYSFLEWSGLVYMLSMGWAIMCDLQAFIAKEEMKKEYRKLQNIRK